ILMKRQDRLLRVAYPLLVAGAELCGKATAPNYGFILHDQAFYADALGEEYAEIASRYYHLDTQVAVRYVHPASPAAAAGLRPGDHVLAINGQSLEGRDVEEAKRIIQDAIRSASTPLPPLLLRIEREGEKIDLTVPGVLACKYTVQLINHDAVNAFADGNGVGITTGMIRFAETDEELALVVGHEIAHNALGHLRKRAGNYFLGTFLDILLAITLGVNTQGLFGALAGQAFSQAFEAEADYAGLYIVARAGYDITNAANFWRRMAVEHPGSIEENFTATHPSTPERFLAIEQTIQEIEAKRRQGKPLLPEEKER
ncbi:MAG: PDZ domain-containing protein, partial [Nitrospinota bacterium]